MSRIISATYPLGRQRDEGEPTFRTEVLDRLLCDQLLKFKKSPASRRLYIENKAPEFHDELVNVLGTLANACRLTLVPSASMLNMLDRSMYHLRYLQKRNRATSLLYLLEKYVEELKQWNDFMDDVIEELSSEEEAVCSTASVDVRTNTASLLTTDFDATVFKSPMDGYSMC